MDIGRAYTFITSDPKWISKILIGAAVSLVPVLNLALYGYALAILKRVYQGVELPLPEWDDFGDYFVRGLLVSIGVLIWQLPLLLLICPVIIAGTVTDSAFVWTLGFACLVPIGVVFSAIIGQVVAARYALSGEFSAMFEFGDIFSEARRGAGLLLLCMLAYIIASLVGIVAGIVTCGIGFLVITPWLTLAQAHLLGQAYRRVRDLPQPAGTAF
ncbi:MAG TPA: DUF4013 domain-containing protein [Thermomicrobiales bacterium]|nr:DUF4013 domain-containing protein [Thermomicrobiales bacterium]